MIVKKTSINTPSIFDKIERYNMILVDDLSKFFQTKDYGEGVKEINYVEVLVPGEIGDESPPKIVYDQQKKTISCVIQPEYKKAVRVNIKRYGLFIAECYIDMSTQFSELNIKGFNSEKYTEDLKYFFKLNKLL